MLKQFQEKKLIDNEKIEVINEPKNIFNNYMEKN